MNQMPSFHPAPGVELLPMKDEGVLFDQTGQRLFHLNAPATFIWSRLDSGQDIDGIAQAMTQAMCVGHVRARRSTPGLRDAPAAGTASLPPAR